MNQGKKAAEDAGSAIKLNRRSFLKISAAGAAALTFGNGCGFTQRSNEGRAGRKPNIVLIVADDLGYGELGVQGSKDIPTPNIDSIARNGVRFTDGYVSCPVCAPTRAGLMSGRYQQRFGFEFNPGPPADADADFGLPRNQKTIAERLKELGYSTGMVGKWHLGHNAGLRPTERGFDEFFGFLGGGHNYFRNKEGDPHNSILRGTEPVEEKEYLTDAFGREAVAFIESHGKDPFFLYLAFNAVHSPLQAPEKYTNRFAHIGDPKRKTFAAMAAAMDDAVGRVLTSIREKGLEDDTLIFFISDNGGPTRNTTSSNGPLRGFKGQVSEGGIRVPFMMQWKRVLPAGQIYRQPVISLDIHATALAAAGGQISPEMHLDGVDLIPFIAGRDKDAPHDTLYWRFGEQRAIRQGEWKLVIQGDEDQIGLYNLEDDIGESKNFADINEEKAQQLLRIWQEWNVQLQEPRWKRQRPARQRKRRRRV